jgi:hypothetical protein
MMRMIAVAIWSLLLVHGASSLEQSQIPAKFGLVWGADAGTGFIRSIPQNSQIGQQNCAASLATGFPPLTFTPVGAGGCPPFGQDFNGIFNQVTAWNQWMSAGGPIFFDSAFSANITGYPKGAMVQSAVLAGRLWLNTIDGNTSNPDSTTGAATGWVVPPGMNPAGTPIAQLTTAIPNGSVPANGLTVGNAASNATSRANADTYWLFTFLWTNCASCSLFNSAGSVVSKGASASADFAANDAIATINMNGTGLIGADSQGGTTSTLLTGVPFISGSATVPGSFAGENLHTLTATQIPTISSINTSTIGLNVTVESTVSDVVQGTVVNTNLEGGPSPVGTLEGGGQGQITSEGTATLIADTVAITSTNTGGAAHNDVQRSVITYWDLSL